MQDKEGRDYCVACKMFLKKEEEKKEEAKPATTPVEPAKEKGIQLAQASKDADGGNSSGGEAKTKEPIFKPSFHNYKGKRSGNNKRGGRKAAGAAIPSQEEVRLRFLSPSFVSNSESLIFVPPCSLG
jgi:hypothetical protein